jgi:hypothetical protein
MTINRIAADLKLNVVLISFPRSKDLFEKLMSGGLRLSSTRGPPARTKTDRFVW